MQLLDVVIEASSGEHPRPAVIFLSTRDYIQKCISFPLHINRRHFKRKYRHAFVYCCQYNVVDELVETDIDSKTQSWTIARVTCSALLSLFSMPPRSR
jgi:hypothetical protein